MVTDEEFLRLWFEGMDDIPPGQQAKNFCEYIRELAIQGLPNEASPLDIMALKEGRKRLVDNFDGLSSLFRAANDDGGYRYVRGLMAAAFILGQSRVLSKETKEFFDDELNKARTAQARNARQQRLAPEKLALKEAIKAVRGDKPPAKPSSEAARILDRVNKRMEENGHDAVSDDKIRRCLETEFPQTDRVQKNFPRSNRMRKNSANSP
jgi:type I site-specific restriction-modification system R (restriction) subunit